MTDAPEPDPLDQAAQDLLADSTSRGQQLQAALQGLKNQLDAIPRKTWPGIPLAIPNLVERIAQQASNWQAELDHEMSRAAGETNDPMDQQPVP